MGIGSRHRTAEAKRHCQRQIGAIAVQHPGGIGDTDTTRLAQAKIDCIIAHAIDRNQLELGAGLNNRIGNACAAGGGNGADLAEVWRSAQVMHMVGRVERGLIPFGIGADLQDIRFGHSVPLGWA